MAHHNIAYVLNMSKVSPKTKASASAKKAIASSNEVIEISDSDDIEIDEVTHVLFDSNSNSSSSSKSGAKTTKKVSSEKEGASGSVATSKKRSISATKKASAAGGGGGNGGVLYGDAFTVDEGNL